MTPLRASNATDRLVALLARIAPDPAGLRDALGDSPDWADALDLLRHHRLMARAHRCLSPWEEHVPEHPWRSLASAASLSRLMNQVVVERGGCVLAALAAGGVAAIPLKGPWLAERLHQAAGARPTADLDLLVRRQDMARAGWLLQEVGYLPDGPQTTVFLESHFLYSPSGPGLRLPRIDLHCHLAGRGDEPWIDRLWSRVESRSSRGTQVLALASVDLILHLSVHAARHRWEHLGHFLDLAQALELEGSTLTWDGLRREATLASLEGCMRLSVSLAAAVCGARLPAAWPQRRSPRTLAGERMLGRRGLLRLNPRLRAGPYLTLLGMLLDDDWGHRGRRLWEAVNPSGDGDGASPQPSLGRVGGKAALLAWQLATAGTPSQARWRSIGGKRVSGDGAHGEADAPPLQVDGQDLDGQPVPHGHDLAGIAHKPVGKL